MICLRLSAGLFSSSIVRFFAGGRPCPLKSAQRILTDFLGYICVIAWINMPVRNEVTPADRPCRNFVARELVSHGIAIAHRAAIWEAS
jgi:hypothetical protein